MLKHERCVSMNTNRNVQFLKSCSQLTHVSRIHFFLFRFVCVCIFLKVSNLSDTTICSFHEKPSNSLDWMRIYGNFSAMKPDKYKANQVSITHIKLAAFTIVSKVVFLDAFNLLFSGFFCCSKIAAKIAASKKLHIVRKMINLMTDHKNDGLCWKGGKMLRENCGKFSQKQSNCGSLASSKLFYGICNSKIICADR